MTCLPPGDRKVGWCILWAQWAGGLGAPVALGTPMAMAERPRPGWASYHSPNTNSCQDLGNSILLLLGLIICINIGINMVTLVRVGPGGRVLAGRLGAGLMSRACLGSLCPSSPSSGADSVASYTKCSIVFMRKVSGGWGAREGQKSSILSLSLSQPLPLPLSLSDSITTQLLFLHPASPSL